MRFQLLRPVAAALLALSLAALPGCSSGGGDGSSDDSGDDYYEVSDGQPRDDATANTISEETKEWMANGLRQFSAKDPLWEETRTLVLDKLDAVTMEDLCAQARRLKIEHGIKEAPDFTI